MKLLSEVMSEVTKQRRCQYATELEEMVLEQITLFLGGHATIVVAIIGIVANSLAVAVFCRSSLLLIDSDIKACHVTHCAGRHFRTKLMS